MDYIEKNMSKEELEVKIVIGEFVNADLPEYVEQYMKLIESLGGNR